MKQTRITEVKTTLSGQCKRFDCERIHFTSAEAVVAYRMPADLELEDLLLPKGTLSLGYFWERRDYNAYHWIDDKRQTLALYLNICDNTRISPDRVEWRDLTVDVLITPDQRCRVLDEEELPDDLDDDLLCKINATRDRLCAAPMRLLHDFEIRSRELLSKA